MNSAVKHHLGVLSSLPSGDVDAGRLCTAITCSTTMHSEAIAAPVDNVVDRLLGGRDHIVKAIVEAIRDALDSAGLKDHEVDDLCGLSESSAIKGKRLHCVRTVLNEPQKLNSFIFSLISIPLQLKADRVLRDYVLRRCLTTEEGADVINYMADTRSGIMAYAGGRQRRPLADAEQIDKLPGKGEAEVFLAVKMFDAVDKCGSKQEESTSALVPA